MNTTDEIDYKELFIKLWALKLQVFLITSIFVTISFVYQIVQPTYYETSFNAHFGSYQRTPTKCNTDVFNIIACHYKEVQPLNLYSENEIKTIEKFISNDNINLIYSPAANSINIRIKSENQEEISKKVLEIVQFVNDKDDKKIKEITTMRNNYLTTLKDYLNFIKKLEDTGAFPFNSINSLSMVINESENLISDETSILKSTISSNKIIIQPKIKLQNLVFSTFLGLFISILISLFRARERVNQ
jgi:hypothetical protein